MASPERKTELTASRPARVHAHHQRSARGLRWWKDTFDRVKWHRSIRVLANMQMRVMWLTGRTRCPLAQQDVRQLSRLQRQRHAHAHGRHGVQR
jgi:hypothetical protein